MPEAPPVTMATLHSGVTVSISRVRSRSRIGLLTLHPEEQSDQCPLAAASIAQVHGQAALLGSGCGGHGFLGAATGIMAVVPLSTTGGPNLSLTLSLFHLVGDNLLVASAVLILQVLVTVFRPPR